jgi:hypothetical protein
VKYFPPISIASFNLSIRSSYIAIEALLRISAKIVNTVSKTFLLLLGWVPFNFAWKKRKSQKSHGDYLECTVNLGFLRVLTAQFWQGSAENCDPEYYKYAESGFWDLVADTVRQFRSDFWENSIDHQLRTNISPSPSNYIAKNARRLKKT